MASSSAFAAGFDGVAFNAAVINTMLMGMPEDPAQRLTWVWARDVTYSPDDPAGNPYDWTSPSVSDVAGNPGLPDTGGTQSLAVPYALEFAPGRTVGGSTVLGEFDTNRAVITMLDEHYQQIKTADYSTIGATIYHIHFVAPPVGLFTTTVWTVYLQAEDQA